MKNAFSILVLLSLLSGCKPDPGTTGHIRSVTKAITTKKLSQADEQHGDWISYGIGYSEDRFSTLDQISTENIDQLGLAWDLDLGIQRGIEATPLVVDGIMFISGPWSVVWAIDARNGTLLWHWDPKLDAA